MSSEPVSRTPEKEELFRVVNDYFTQDLHTCMPGRIETYDPETQKCSVKPTIKRRVVMMDGQETLEELPVIPDVPVVFQRSTEFFLSFPLRRGDLVAIHFAERSLDAWLSGAGEDTDPGELRRFDLTDAIAVPGLYPFRRALKDAHAVNLVLGHDNDGMQLHITPNGTCEFRVNGASQEAVMLGNAFKVWWESRIAPWLATHTHPSGMGPTGPALQPLPAFDDAIISTLFRLAGG